MTPPDSVAAKVKNKKKLSFDAAISTPSAIPWPGSVYIMRSAATGEVLTFFEGKLIMAKPGGPGSFHWACVETNGWLGFRNTTSGRFLGHKTNQFINCKGDSHNKREWFCTRMKPKGGYILYVRDDEELCPVQSLVPQEALSYPHVKKGKLALVKFHSTFRATNSWAKMPEMAETMIWEFVKVE